MQADTEKDKEVLSPEVSLIRGGPFYHAQLKARLIRTHEWQLGRRVAVAIVVGWLPVVLLALIFPPHDIMAVISDYKVGVRMLVAVPVLLIGQMLMECRFRTIVSTVREDLIRPQDFPQLDASLEKLVKMRDSILPELIVAALVVTHVLWWMTTGKIELEAAWAVMPSGTHLTPAGWYYTLMSQLIFQILIGLSPWKWLLWTYFLFRLSQIKLQLMVSHPDKHGGLGFLGLSIIAFNPIAFAVAAAIGASWRHQILFAGAAVSSFKFETIVFFLICAVIAVGPLMLFAPRLAALRRTGILEYGSLAQIQNIEFHDRWILHRAGREDQLIAAPEVTTLSNMAASFHNIEEMKALPVDRNSLVSLALAIVVPLIPAITAQVPIKEILKHLMEAIK